MVDSSPRRRSLRPRNDVNYKQLNQGRSTPSFNMTTYVNGNNNNNNSYNNMKTLATTNNEFGDIISQDPGRITATTSINTATAILSARNNLRGSVFRKNNKSNGGYLSETESINLYTSPIKDKSQVASVTSTVQKKKSTTTPRKSTRVSRKKLLFLDEELNHHKEEDKGMDFSDTLSVASSNQREDQQHHLHSGYHNSNSNSHDDEIEKENMPDMMPTPKPRFNFFGSFLSPSRKHKTDRVEDTEIELELASELDELRDNEAKEEEQDYLDREDNFNYVHHHVDEIPDEDLDELEVFEELEMSEDSTWSRLVDTKLFQLFRPFVVFSSSVFFLIGFALWTVLKFTAVNSGKLIVFTYLKMFKSFVGWSLFSLLLASSVYYYYPESFNFNPDIYRAVSPIRHTATEKESQSIAKDNLKTLLSLSEDDVTKLDSIILRSHETQKTMQDNIERLEKELDELKINHVQTLQGKFGEFNTGIENLRKMYTELSTRNSEKQKDTEEANINYDKDNVSQNEDKVLDLKELFSKIDSLESSLLKWQHLLPIVESAKPMLEDQRKILYKYKFVISGILNDLLVKQYGLHDTSLIKLRDFVKYDLEEVKNTVNIVSEKQIKRKVENLVEGYLQKLNIDTIVLPDFALESAGASIISSFTSPTFSVPHQNQIARAFGTAFGIKKTLGKPPNTSLQPSLQIGECWAMEGKSGTLGIQLARPMIPEAVTVDHISKEFSFEGIEGLKTAPKDIRLWAIIDRQKADSYPYLDMDPLQNRKQWQDIDMSINEYPPIMFLDQFTFDPMKEGNHKSSQTFQIDQSVRNILSKTSLSVQDVVFHIQNNWGNDEWTCIYRVRVHGHAK